MNPFNILSIPENATDEEIKKAYRKLAAKHHPDKGGDEKLFKQINEAYSIIGSPEKRQRYESSQNIGGFGDVFGNFGDIFDGFFGRGSSGRRGKLREQTDNEIMFDFKISLSQIKEGISQNIVFNRNKRCHMCEGIGGKNKKRCTSCDGKGVQTVRAGMMIQQFTCRDCYGDGHTFQEKCSFCHGDGMIQIKENIKFTVSNE